MSVLTCVVAGGGAGGGGGGSGTVTSVSVVSANGFAGSVANATTTPAITLTTTITGILSGNGTAISAASTTGSGAVVLATSPTLVTPVLGVATATTVNKVTITAPASGSTLTIADGVTLTASSTATVSSQTQISTINFVIDGGGATIVAGVKGDFRIPFGCTITEATVLGDQSGSIVLDIWKAAFATGTSPTVANTITASAKPTVSSTINSTDTTLTGWTTSVSAGDCFRINVDSVTTMQRATLMLKFVKT